MSDKLKTEMVHNGDGTVTMRITEDISDEVKFWEDAARRGEIALVYNIGPSNETALMVTPSATKGVAWRKVDE